jgi:hypothetical protein
MKKSASESWLAKFEDIFDTTLTGEANKNSRLQSWQTLVG